MRCGIKSISILSALIILFLFNGTAQAEEEIGEEEGKTQKLIKVVDTSRDYVSKSLVTATQKIDSYFASEENLYDSNETYLVLSSDFIYDREKRLIYDTSFNLNIDLPNINRRLNLVIQSKESDKSSGEVGEKELPEIANDQTTRPVQASLQYVFRQAKRWRVSGDIGATLPLPLEPFARTRARRSWRHDLGTSKLSQTVTWFFSDQWQSKTSHQINVPTGQKNLLRNDLSVFWDDEEPDLLTLNEDIIFYHIISEKLLFRYQLGATAVNHPQQRMTEYRLIPTLRRDIYKGWLFIDFGPRFRLNRPDNQQDWREDHAFIVTFELFFQHK